MKIFEDASTKTETSLPTYDTVTYTKSPSILFQPLQDSCYKLPRVKPASYTQTRLGRVSKPSPRYEPGMNKDIQVLMANLNEFLAMPDRGGHDIADETDPQICLVNRF